MSQPFVSLTLDAAPDTVCALVEFLKRAQWGQFRACAADDEEANEIKAGIEALRKHSQPKASVHADILIDNGTER